MLASVDALLSVTVMLFGAQIVDVICLDCFVLFGIVWNCVGLFQKKKLRPFGIVWDCMGLFGMKHLDCLGLFWIVLDCFGLFWTTVWDCLELFGIVCDC